MPPCRFAAAALLFLIATACGSRGPKPAILLFTGGGTSPGDVAAIETILKNSHLDYDTVGSLHLNLMTAAQIREYRLLIVPGGNFIRIGNRLTPDAVAHIRTAVRSGTNYLGICAGAFFAGDSPSNGLNLTGGVRFPFYAAEDRGIHKQAVAVAAADGKTLDQYWEDGPQLSGWGSVVANYPDATPAIVEGTYGSGWVVLSGVHPEAPAPWRHGMNFTTPLEANHAFARNLIEAALKGAALPHF
jgi:glutamine amidotransferase-like uncharacterized protein